MENRGNRPISLNNVDYLVLVELYSRYLEVSRHPARTSIDKLNRHGIREALMDNNSVVRYLLFFARNGTSGIHLPAPSIHKPTPQRINGPDVKL